MSFLPKQEARPFCACYWVPAGQARTQNCLDSRFRGNDTPQTAVVWPQPPSRRPGKR